MVEHVVVCGEGVGREVMGDCGQGGAGGKVDQTAGFRVGDIDGVRNGRR